MKQSRYNILLEASQDRTLVFNGMSKRFFYLSSRNIPSLRTILESPDEYSSRDEYKDFLSSLKNNGFLIDDNFSEIERLSQLYKSYRDAKIYNLMILTTYACNFSCWYCVQKHRNITLKTETIAKIKKHISNYLLKNDIKAFDISWFGGEPLLNFNAIREICTFAKEFCNQHKIEYSCGITTNGSLITPDMTIEMRHLCFKSYQITIDGVKENHNNTRYNASIQDSFTKILENIALLTVNVPDADITVRFNYTHNNLNEDIVDQVDSILGSCKEKVELLFRKVWQEPDSLELANNLYVILGKFKEKGYKILHDFDNIKLTSCYVEQTHYNSIFPDGTIDKCSNMDIEEARGYLSDNGNIIWKTTPLENKTNVFNFPSDCLECKYLPLCMGPCPLRRSQLISENKIHCIYENKDQIFLDDIKNFVLLNEK
jgi:uncharacterized protein